MRDRLAAGAPAAENEGCGRAGPDAAAADERYADRGRQREADADPQAGAAPRLGRGVSRREAEALSGVEVGVADAAPLREERGRRPVDGDVLARDADRAVARGRGSDALAVEVPLQSRPVGAVRHDPERAPSLRSGIDDGPSKDVTGDAALAVYAVELDVEVADRLPGVVEA